MAHLNFGAHPSKKREATVNIAVSGSSRCTWNYIFTHSEAHDGVARARNTNLSALDSENMWYQHILIQLLAALILLQPLLEYRQNKYSRTNFYLVKSQPNVVR